MDASRGMLIACLVVGLAAGCGQGSKGNDGSGGATESTSGTEHREAAPATSHGSPTRSREDPATAYTSALQPLIDAPSITYSMTSAIEMGPNGIRFDRQVSVDVGRQLASTRVRLLADVPGKPKTDLTMIVINQADTAYLNMPSWTDSRRGKWMPITDASAASMGVPLEVTTPSTVPAGLADFRATGMPTSDTIEGTLDAQSGFGLLGLSGALKDPQIAASLTGRIPAIVTIDPSSKAISQVRVTGKGNTVTSSSDSVPLGTLQQMLEWASATITIKEIGRPVTISVPSPDNIISN